MRLYFARHGESEANVLGIHSNRDLPHHLTNAGRQQAKALARRLKAENISALYNSPTLRAVETAEILSSMLGIPYHTADALREYDCGVIEGKPYQEGGGRYEKVLRDWMELGYWESRIEGGESFIEMKNRFVPFVDELVAAHEASGANIVLVSHGGLYRCMLPLILDHVSEAFAMAHMLTYTEMVIAEPHDGGLICLSWGPVLFK